MYGKKILISIYVISLILLCFSSLYATPGPDSVAILANSQSQDSMALADHYMQTRHIPIAHRCDLPLPITDDIDWDQFITQLYQPFFDCLGEHSQNIEAIVMMRDTPLRTYTMEQEGSVPSITLSTASLLAWSRTTTRSGESILLHPLIQQRPCGTQSCWTAHYENPWQAGPFYSNWSAFKNQLAWKMYLVTRIDALNTMQAHLLMEHAEQTGITISGTQNLSRENLSSFVHLFMQAANAPRAILDLEFSAVAQALQALGLRSEIVAFDSNAQWDETLASMIVGSESLMSVIENNQYMFGSLVDNLTSYAAHPHNFHEDLPEVQAAITRWIPYGATGLHACTDEPLNDSFPSRWFLVDYAYGASLAEAFYRHIPFAFWQNLVLGDPMVAVYSQRPAVAVRSYEDGSNEIYIEDPLNRDVEYLSIWHRDQLWDIAYRRQSITICEAEDMEVLVIAQVYGEAGQSVDGGEGWPAKGWKKMMIPACQASPLYEDDMHMIDEHRQEDAYLYDLGFSDDIGINVMNHVDRGEAPSNHHADAFDMEDYTRQMNQGEHAHQAGAHMPSSSQSGCSIIMPRSIFTHTMNRSSETGKHFDLEWIIIMFSLILYRYGVSIHLAQIHHED